MRENDPKKKKRGEASKERRRKEEKRVIEMEWWRKKEQKEKERGRRKKVIKDERKMNKKLFFFFNILNPYRSKDSSHVVKIMRFGTYYERGFLVFVMSNAKYLAFDTPNENALIRSLVGH